MTGIFFLCEFQFLPRRDPSPLSLCHPFQLQTTLHPFLIAFEGCAQLRTLPFFKDFHVTLERSPLWGSQRTMSRAAVCVDFLQENWCPADFSNYLAMEHPWGLGGHTVGDRGQTQGFKQNQSLW